MSTQKKSFKGNPALSFITTPEPEEPTEQVQESVEVSVPANSEHAASRI